MTKELEIEFKNLLNEQEYHQLLVLYGYKSEDAKTQVNHYFDTADFRLKEQRSALRIRQKGNHFECTLKIPAETGNYEITDKLNEQQAEDVIKSESFQAPEVLAALKEKGISAEQLEHIGTLTTHRIEFSYEGGLLVLDHSEYCGVHDYEVEYEVSDAQRGEQLFNEFLNQQGIPKRHADKKIARFMKAAKSRS